MPADRLTFYRSGVKREWRWRLQDGGNHRKLANGGESFKNLEDALRSAFDVLVIISDPPPHKWGRSVERANGEHINVVFKG